MTTSWSDRQETTADGAQAGRGNAARDDWSPALRLAFRLISASDLPGLLVLRDGLEVHGNAAFDRLQRPGTSAGSPLSKTGLSHLARPIRRVIETDTSAVCRNQTVSRRGPFDAYLAPVAEDDGSVVAVHCALAPAPYGDAYGRPAPAALNRHDQAARLAEMTHRAKNILSMVQAIARLTLGVDQKPAFDVFEARLLALARTQDLLNVGFADSIDLQTLLDLILAPVPVAAVDRAGPPLRISSRAAVTLSLGLHELMTNALKYGALSVAAGRVVIRWSASLQTGGPVRLTWEESGGPPVRPPLRKGFGLVVIERMMAAELPGMVTMRFDPAGLVCTIIAALEVAQDAADALAAE